MQGAARSAAEGTAALAASWWLGHGAGTLAMLLPGALVAPVALVAAQHGLLPGVVIGACAGTLVMLDAGQAPASLLGFEGDRLALAAAYAHVALGAAVGLVGEGHRRARRAAAERQAHLAAQLAHAEGAVSALAAAKHALERRFARQVLPVEALGREAQALAGLPAGDAVPAALALAERFLGAHAAAWYEPVDGGWMLAAGRGQAPPPGAVAARGSLVETAAATRALMAARSPEARSDGGAWLAVPVTGPTGVVGVLALLDLPFERLTPVAEAALGELARGLGAALPAEAPERGTIVWIEGPAVRRAEEAGRLPEAS